MCKNITIEKLEKILANIVLKLTILKLFWVVNDLHIVQYYQ